MTWEQWTQTVITSGDVRYIRLWDTERELKDYDIPTGSTCSVTCIDSTYSGFCSSAPVDESRASSPDDEGLVMKGEMGSGDFYRRSKSGLIAIGFADGSVRLFDRRLSPAEAKVKTWREHGSWVLGLQLRGDKIVTGRYVYKKKMYRSIQIYGFSTSGDVRIFDIRQNSSISTCQVSNEMTALTVHRNANMYACGSVNSTINVHHLNGQTVNTIRFYEGFMGHRIGPVSCLAYHPHRIALAAGTVDCSVSVYCIDQRR